MPTRRARCAEQLPSEACFARSFPELADASTAEIREAMALARGAVVRVRKEQRRVAAMQAWMAENQLTLPYPGNE